MYLCINNETYVYIIPVFIFITPGGYLENVLLVKENLFCELWCSLNCVMIVHINFVIVGKN